MNKKLKKIALSAILGSLAIALELITEYVPGLNIKMPYGGSPFGLSMLLIILAGIINGWGYGISTGVIVGAINFLIGNGSSAVHWGSFFFDYILAFGVLGLSGFFPKSIKKIPSFIIVIVACCFLRYIFHSLSGLIFFGEYAPEGVNPFVYSFIYYNAPYMAVSTAICTVIGVLIRPTVLKLEVKYDLNQEEVKEEQVV